MRRCHSRSRGEPGEIVPNTLPTTPWVECPSIDLNLKTPHTDRYRDVPHDAIERGSRLLRAVMAEMPWGARFLADVVRVKTRNRFHAEASAFAKILGVSWREIVVANISYDLVLSMFHCSTIALPTPDGPVLARNMDWWPEDILAQTSYLVRCHNGGDLGYAIAGWPGAIGAVTGMAGRGFAVALNAVQCPDGLDKTGYPVLLHIRRVLEDAADFSSAVRMLSDERLVAPGLLTVVGIDNDERAVIERTPKRCAIRRAVANQPLVTTNHYRLLETAPKQQSGAIDETTCGRYDSLTSLCKDHDASEPINDERLLYMLTEPSVIQEITAQHVIMRPRSKRIRMFVPRRLITG